LSRTTSARKFDDAAKYSRSPLLFVITVVEGQRAFVDDRWSQNALVRPRLFEEAVAFAGIVSWFSGRTLNGYQIAAVITLLEWERDGSNGFPRPTA
jgi:hypothetical protein